MTDISPSHPISNPSVSPSLLKPVLDQFHNVLPYVWLAACGIAAVLNLISFPNVFGSLPMVAPLMIFALVSGTYLMLYDAHKGQREATARIQHQNATGVNTEAEDQDAANAVIPGYVQMLVRNLMVMVVYLPLVLIGTVIFTLSYQSAWVLYDLLGVYNAYLVLVFQVLTPFTFGIWLISVVVGWHLSARLIDRLTGRQISLPVSDKVRKRQEAVRLRSYPKAADGSPDVPDADNDNLLSLQDPIIEIPASFQAPLRPFDPQKFQNDPLRAHIDDHRLHASTEHILQRSAIKYLVMMIVLANMSAFLLSRIALALGMDEAQARQVFDIASIVGTLGAFVLLNRVVMRFSPLSKVIQANEAWQETMLRGNYSQGIQMVEQFTEELPNWESKLMRASTYAQANQLEKAELIALDLLDEVSHPETEYQRQVFKKTLLTRAFGMLAEIYVMQGRLDMAEEGVMHGLKYNADEFPINNSAAKLHLLRGNAAASQPHIEQAFRDYGKQKKPVSGYNRGLHAWALALQGDTAQADTAMVEAIRMIPPEHVIDLAELYWIGGHIAKAQKKYTAARMSFEKAMKFDPEGVYGAMAERELQAL